MFKKLKTLIKSQDLVGHQVNLTFNGRGNVHQTFLGGIISSFFLIFLLKMTYNYSFQMVTHGNDNISKVTSSMSDHDELKKISMIEERM